MDKTDAVAFIGETATVENAIASIDPKMAEVLRKHPDFGTQGKKVNPEMSGNWNGITNSNNNIIAVNTEDAEEQTHEDKVTLSEAIAFDITHGAGHNAGLPHGVEQPHEYNDSRIIPNGSIMSDGQYIFNGIATGSTTLSGYVKSTLNEGVVKDHYKASFNEHVAQPNPGIPVLKMKIFFRFFLAAQMGQITSNYQRVCLFNDKLCLEMPQDWVRQDHYSKFSDYEVIFESRFISKDSGSQVTVKITDKKYNPKRVGVTAWLQVERQSDSLRWQNFVFLDSGIEMRGLHEIGFLKYRFSFHGKTVI